MRGFGRASLMVGAGFSLNARSLGPTDSFPTWSRLMEAMISDIVDADSSQIDELWRLSGSTSGALRIAQEYVVLHGRSSLNSLLKRLVPDASFAPGPLHIQALQLPWCDIFTTNWDTLLERGAATLYERSYTSVVRVSDIPQTHRPRIVKLHGTFPSHHPFILTEDDFRRYPVDFAPFVTLVRHSMMESVFCLIGFSGDDPNFLAWSGWVRDALGEHAPKIYLVGVLNLRSGHRRMLEERGVQPIDLTQLFIHAPAPVEDKHSQAYNWFFRNLQAGQPDDPIEWPSVGTQSAPEPPQPWMPVIPDPPGPRYRPE